MQVDFRLVDGGRGHGAVWPGARGDAVRGQSDLREPVVRQHLPVHRPDQVSQQSQQSGVLRKWGLHQHKQVLLQVRLDRTGLLNTGSYHNDVRVTRNVHNAGRSFRRNGKENHTLRKLPRLKHSISSRCTNVRCRGCFCNVCSDGFVLQVSCST